MTHVLSLAHPGLLQLDIKGKKHHTYGLLSFMPVSVMIDYFSILQVEIKKNWNPSNANTK